MTPDPTPRSRSLAADAPRPPPSRTRFALAVVFSGLVAGSVLFVVAAPSGGWQALLLFQSLGLTFASLAGIVAFRRMQRPLEQALLSGTPDLTPSAPPAAALVDTQAGSPADAMAPGTVTDAVLVAPAAEADAAADARPDRAPRADAAWIEAVLDATRDGIVVIDRLGLIRAISAEAAAWMSRQPAEMIGKPLAVAMPLHDARRPEPLAHPLAATILRWASDPPTGSRQMPVLLERRGRTSMMLRLDVLSVPARGGREAGLVLRLSAPDTNAVAERQPSPPELISGLDPLTGAHDLPHLRRQIAALIDPAADAPDAHGLIVFAIEDFDDIHASAGPVAGEQRLWQIAGAIAEAALAPACFHRISARHFALLMPRASRSACEGCAGAVVQSARGTGATLSAGLAMFGSAERGPDAVIDEAARQIAAGADAAADAAERRVGLSPQALRERLAAGALRLVAQPIVAVDAAATAAAASWQEIMPKIEDDRGLWRPLSDLRPMIARAGLAGSVERAVLVAALAHPVDGKTLLLPVSGAALASDDWFDGLEACLSTGALPATQLCLAIDEREAIRQPQRAAALARHGALLALDDWRAAHGLDELRALAPACVRLAPALVAQARDPTFRGQLEWRVAGAHLVGAQVIAPAVDDPDTRERLRLARVDLVQGSSVLPAAPF